jgi:hypothetical protein
MIPLLQQLTPIRTTLPDTNTLSGARQAQLWLGKDGIHAEIWSVGDQWMLEAPTFQGESFMNIPVFRSIS